MLDTNDILNSNIIHISSQWLLWSVGLLLNYTYFIYKKLRIGASAESFLKFSDFDYSGFVASFLKVSKESFCSLPVPR